MALLMVLLGLGGCGGSPPVRDHTLATIPPTHAAASRSAGKLRVGDVDIPPVLDRNEIVTGASPTALTVHRQDVWAAPLSGLIQRTLSADLAARLGEGRVLAVGDPTSPPGTRTL
ncbi:MAG TPA: ABC-type transport auxiliary lipoprotein family protein, partial [Acetobacteraceae bacterium]